MIDSKNYEKNLDIKSKEIYLITLDENTGKDSIILLNIEKALEKAFNEGLDLVKLGEKNNLPICKIFNLDSFLYKKEKSKKKIQPSKLKTIKLSVNIEQGDLERKIDQMIKFIEKYNMVQAIIMKRKLRKRFELIPKMHDKIISVFQDKKLNLVFTKKDNTLLITKK